MMKSLGRDFGAVNRRICCCKYLLATRTIPAYCAPFNEGEFDLEAHCKAHVWKAKDLLDFGKQGQNLTNEDLFSQGGDYVSVTQPVEWVLAKQDDEAGTWACSRVGPMSPGKFPIDEVEGDYEQPLAGGVISVKVLSEYNGAELRLLRFNEYGVVDVPPMLDPDAEGDPDSELVPEERGNINVILNAGETCMVAA